MKVLARLAVLSAVVFVGCLLGGCTERGEEGRTVSSANAPPVQDQIKQIENNPNMPAQAKAAAIQQIKSRQGYNPGPQK